MRTWADRIGTADQALAELDLWLSHSLGLIAASEWGPHLCFKGGTAPNKLYVGDVSRLSVDLDFNALGEEAAVYARARPVREGLTALLAGAGAELHRHKYGVAGDHLLFRYDSEILATKQSFKVEISSLERFAALGLVERPLTIPSTTGPALYDTAQVRTAGLIELIATKIRAFHQRRKGRDLYDLWLARSRVPDVAVLRKLVLFYFACRDVPFDRRAFFATLDDKLSDRRFNTDVDAFLRGTSPFVWQTAADEVRAWLEEVLALDEQDERFVLGVRHLNGSATGPNAAAAAAALGHPLPFLLGDRVTLGQPATDFTAEDLRRLMARARPVRDRDEGI